MEDGWSSAISRAYDEQPVASLPGTNGSVGRPRGRFAEIDWILGEELYTQGELIDSADGGEPERVWPTLAELGKRLGCTMQAISYHAKRGNWQERRRKYQYQHEFGELTAQLEGQPNPASRLTRKPLEILEDYLALFQNQIEAKKLRADAIGDFDKAVRLRAFLLNEGAAEQSKRQVMGLEEMRDRHEASRKRRSTYDEIAAGVVQQDGPNDKGNPHEARAQTHASEAQETQPPSARAPKPTKEPKPRKTFTTEELSARAKKAAETVNKRRRRKAGFKR